MDRIRLVLVCLAVLALPIGIVIVGSLRPEPKSVDAAGADESSASRRDASSRELVTTKGETADSTAAPIETPSSEPQPSGPVADPSATGAGPPAATGSSPNRGRVPDVALTTTTNARTPDPRPAAPSPAPLPSDTGPAPRPPGTTGQGSAIPGASQGESAFLACARQRASGGDYKKVSGDRMGAYQLSQTTWNMAAPWARNDRLVGTDLTGQKPNTVSKPDQDAVALALYRRTNSALLGGPCS